MMTDLHGDSPGRRRRRQKRRLRWRRYDRPAPKLTQYWHGQDTNGALFPSKIIAEVNVLQYRPSLLYSTLLKYVTPIKFSKQGQPSLAIPPWVGAMSTSESWGINRHTARCTSPVSVVWQCKLVSGTLAEGQRNGDQLRRMSLMPRKWLYFTFL